MNDLLLQLRDKGNTVLVVEHKPEVIDIAEHVVDLGPLAGTEGGQVVYEGPSRACGPAVKPPGSTSTTAASKPSVRTPSGVLEVRGASA